MPEAIADASFTTSDLFRTCRSALGAADTLLAAARQGVAGLVSRDGKVDNAAFEREQFAAHGLSWTTTYVEGLRQMLAWGERLQDAGNFRELEQLILRAAYGEYLDQLTGGLSLSQGEVLRPADMGVPAEAVAAFLSEDVRRLQATGNTPPVRARIAELIADGDFGNPGFDDDMLGMVQDQFRRFCEDKVTPFAHGWHLRDELIPIEVVDEMAELGVFGLTVPEEWG
ncbi:MAG: acyl-CoA dehydrogenase family protein, partial [Rhodospirillales bacterium]